MLPLEATLKAKTNKLFQILQGFPFCTSVCQNCQNEMQTYSSKKVVPVINAGQPTWQATPGQLKTHRNPCRASPCKTLVKFATNEPNMFKLPCARSVNSEAIVVTRRQSFTRDQAAHFGIWGGRSPFHLSEQKNVQFHAVSSTVGTSGFFLTLFFFVFF